MSMYRGGAHKQQIPHLATITIMCFKILSPERKTIVTYRTQFNKRYLIGRNFASIFRISGILFVRFLFVLDLYPH